MALMMVHYLQHLTLPLQKLNKKMFMRGVIQENVQNNSTTFINAKLSNRKKKKKCSMALGTACCDLVLELNVRKITKDLLGNWEILTVG